MLKKIKNDVLLRLYGKITAITVAIFILLLIGVYAIDKTAGFVALLFFMLYIVALVYIIYKNTPGFNGEIVKYAANYDKIQNRLLKDLSIPYMIIDTEGALLWANEAFVNVIGNEKEMGKSIFNIFTDLTVDNLPIENMYAEEHVEYNDVNYKVCMNQVDMNNVFGQESDSIINKKQIQDNNKLIAVYLYDETEIIKCLKENNEQRIVVGLLYIDNYEEVFENVDEVKRAMLGALVERKITKYMQTVDALVKKLEKDKYFVVFKKKYLDQLHANKYNILDEVKTINVGNEISITLSFGLGVDAETLDEGYEYARAAIDLALGRGGDQVVVKDKDKIVYYGGRRVQVEKSTRVKARVKAQALREIIIGKDDIFIMGHAIEDIDSFGAAMGIYRIAKSLGKRAHVVINDITTTVKPFMHRFLSDNEYENNLFLTSDKALEIVTDNSALIIVDVNKPTYTECPELLNRISTKIVLDHHRQSGETIDGAVLSYIEPYASSTCEMVAEILQYIDARLRLRAPEADAMFAGIMIDTNNFLTKTGVRTFEAAAFLRRNGADILRIRKALRADMEEYRVRAEAISNVELFSENYAITVCNAKDFESPTIIGAQVANELLDIAGVKASFVLTPFNNKIYVSARSIDEVNVQIIMEKFGGGGHMTVAGAQIQGEDVEVAKQEVKEQVKDMLINSEI